MLDYVGGTSPIYIGEATPGKLTSVAVWRIKKLTYVGGMVTEVKWASGTLEFDKIWDNRATYTYS